MKALIVIESCFANTEKIAQAIATGLRSRGSDVEVAYANHAPDISDAELLVVGSPTHMLGLPKPSTRQQAEERGGHPQDTGVAEWLDSLSQVPGRNAATFATVTGGHFSGSAAKAIRKRMRRLSANVIAFQDFRVQGTEGPLADGELARAEQWGASLA